MIQIGSGHEVFFANIKNSLHFIRNCRTLVEALVGTQTHFEFQELAQIHDVVQVNASLFVQEEMTHFTHLTFDAQTFGQHPIQHIRLGHFNDVEFGQLGTGRVGS